MIDKNNLLKKLGLQEDSVSQKKDKNDSTFINDMTSSSYLRQSASLINDALKNGFDVLQMANGDIVTTGTKIIVTRYKWDLIKGKLVKMKPDSKTASKEIKEPDLAVEQEALKKETEEA